MFARAMNLRTAQLLHVALHNISKLTEPLKRRIRAHLEGGATRVALRPVHANGDCAARDAVLKVMTDF